MQIFRSGYEGCEKTNDVSLSSCIFPETVEFRERMFEGERSDRRDLLSQEPLDSVDSCVSTDAFRAHMFE